MLRNLLSLSLSLLLTPCFAFAGWRVPPADSAFEWQLKIDYRCDGRPFEYSLPHELVLTPRGLHQLDANANLFGRNDETYDDRRKHVRLDHGRVFVRGSDASSEILLGTIEEQALYDACYTGRDRWGIATPTVTLAAGVTIDVQRSVGWSLCLPKFAVGTISRAITYDFTIRQNGKAALKFHGDSQFFFQSRQQCQAWTDDWQQP